MKKEQNKKYELSTVKLSNKANMLCYEKFTATELNFLTIILSKATQEINKNNNEITISKGEIFKNLGYTKEQERKIFYPKRMNQDEENSFMYQFSNKLLNNIRIKKEATDPNNREWTIIFNLFQGIGYARDFEKYNEEEDVLRVYLSEGAIKILRNLGEDNPYFKYKVIDYVKIKNIYAKRIYQLIKQYQKIGNTIIKKEDLEILLGVKDKYKNNNFEKIIKPAIKELQQFYKNLRYETIKNKQLKNKVIAYKFIWKKEIEDLEEEEQKQEIETKIYNDEQINFILRKQEEHKEENQPYSMYKDKDIEADALERLYMESKYNQFYKGYRETKRQDLKEYWKDEINNLIIKGIIKQDWEEISQELTPEENEILNKIDW